MDLFTALWILFWGLIPPIATGWFAFRIGKKGRDQAYELRDLAYAKINDLEDQLRTFKESLTKMEHKILSTNPPTAQEISALIKIPEIPKVPTAQEISALIKIPEIPKVPTAQEISALIKIPDISIPEDQMKTIRESLVKTVNGAYGNIVKEMVKEANDGITDEAKLEQARLTLGDKIRMKIMNKVMDLI